MDEKQTELEPTAGIDDLEEKPPLNLHNVNHQERHIDWDRVVAFTELKAVVMALNITIWEDPDEPDEQFDCIRHLLKPDE